jgi:uncharacterized protein YceH (UPF0502 family)
VNLLDPVEARIIGALMEKERTTPDAYPLTMNALLTACNQSTNRNPVMTLGASEVETALELLRSKGYMRFVHPSHGERATKYRQVMQEALELRTDESAVVCVLLLRGPQTLNEIRTRTERLHGFGSLDEVDAVLDRLAGREPQLAMPVGRQPGQKEGRYAQLLTGMPSEEELAMAASSAAAAGGGGAASTGRNDRLAAIEAEVQALRAEVAELRTLVDKQLS